MHLMNDIFPAVLFASEERAVPEDFAHIDARNLKTYAKRRLRQYIASNDDHNALDFTEAQIEVVGRAFEYSALRLPAMMRLELLNEYADRPTPITRANIETLATEWEQPTDEDPTEPDTYKVGVDVSTIH